MALTMTIIHNYSRHSKGTAYVSGPILCTLKSLSHLLFTKPLMQWVVLSPFCRWGGKLTELSWPGSHRWGCWSGRWAQISASSSLALEHCFTGCRAVCKLYLCEGLLPCYPHSTVGGLRLSLSPACRMLKCKGWPGWQWLCPSPPGSPAAEELPEHGGLASVVTPPRPSFSVYMRCSNYDVLF